MKKTFSIIIPYYYGEKLYSNLLNSIFKSIKNCSEKTIFFEIITIIDSVETSLAEIDNLSKTIFFNLKNVTLINKKNNVNIGVAATRNKAILISKGDYLHIIDQDDEVLPEIYSESLKHLNEYNFLLFNGMMHYPNKNFNTHKIFYFAPNLSLKGLIQDDFIRSPGQVVFAKSLLHEKLFPEPIIYKGADDRFFWMRIFKENTAIIKAKYLNKPYYIATLHANNFSNDRANLDMSCLESWSIFISEMDLSEYSFLISNDILRISYKLKKPMPFLKKLKGFFLQLIFNLKLSKMIRFIIKRIK